MTEGPTAAPGVELRQPRLNLTTVARSVPAAVHARHRLGQRFDRVAGTLHLPPGHRLIAALGVDEAPDSWWERWGLWNVFGVVIIVGFVYWAAGRVPAAIAALALRAHLPGGAGDTSGCGATCSRRWPSRAPRRRALPAFARGYRTLSFVRARPRAAAVPVDPGALRAVSAARGHSSSAYGIDAMPLIRARGRSI